MIGIKLIWSNHIMRISYLFNSSTPSSNPGSIQVVNTCDGIASHGHKIILITPNTGKNVALKKFYGIKII